MFLNESLVIYPLQLLPFSKLSSLLFQLKTMRKEDYQKIITDLEIHYQEFLRNSQGSEMFGDEDKRKIQTQFTDAQKHYQTLIIQLPNQPRPPQTGLLSSCFLVQIVLLGFPC